MRTNLNQKLKPVAFTVLLGCMSMLAIDAQSPGESASNNGEHGDNPVVGSLPVEVSPDLDLMFAEEGRATFPFTEAMLGLVGDADLEHDILDAGGVPTGRINKGGAYDVFGLVRSGHVTFPREEGRKDLISTRLWVPSDFIGGEIVMNSTVGLMETEIVGNLTRLPVRFLCNSISPVVDAWLTITPHRDSTMEPLSVHVSIVGETVKVTYLP